MKNFRKVLALILVVATLFSFVAMASARTPGDYADYADVKNVEAVDVMTALGINEGYDGKFHPADTIDRDEVAAMIARLRNGGKFDAAYYVGADNVFADVKGQWSEGYVTYCAQLGIINGLNATTFNPDGKITVVDTLKLLLCVLGYDAQLQGYVGPNYKVAVVRDAEKMGLTAGIAAADMFKEATRDQVALMFFNALKARLVFGYVSENIVTITNSLLKDFPGITVPDMADPAIELAYNNAIISDVTLGNVLGVKSATAYDCYGRPGTMWFANGWNKFYPAAYVAEKHDGTAPVAAAKVTELFVNGQSVDAANIAAYLGKGNSAEAYALGGDTYRVVIVESVLAEVTAVYKRTGKAEITTVEEGKKLTVDAGTLAVGNVVEVKTCGLYNTYIEADDEIALASVESVKAHAELADTLTCADHTNAGYVHSYKVVAPVQVQVAETHIYADRLAKSYIKTVDGAEYSYAATLGHDLDLEKDIVTAANKGSKLNLWLDEYGYIKYWEVATTAGAGANIEVAYFVEGSNKFTTIHEGTDVPQGTHVYSATADIVKMDTSKANIAITIDDTRLSEDDLAAGKLEDTYTIMLDRGSNKAGCMYDGVFARYNTANGAIVEQAATASAATWIDAANGELVNETAPNGLNYHFDANTNFLVRTWDIATGAPSYEAVKGYKAMPEYLGKLIFGDEATYNTIQYLTDGNGYITDLFIDAYYVKTAAQYVYIVEKVKDIGVAALGNYYYDFAYYKAFINGAEAYVAYFNVNANENNAAWTGADLEGGKLYATAVKGINATYEGAPIYVAMTDANLQPWAGAGEYTNVVVKNGQIELYNGAVQTEIVASKYLDELSVYVLSGAADVPYAVMNGAEYVKLYQNDPEFAVKADAAAVYKMGAPVSILILTIG